VIAEKAGERGLVCIGTGHVPHGSVAATMADDRSTPDEQLARYRASIDNIDAALVHLLAERFKITQEVGRYKAAVGLPAADPLREEQQVARLRALAVESGLDPVFSEKFLRFIVAEVIHHHQQHAEQESSLPD
jgi:chorismate mutase